MTTIKNIVRRITIFYLLSVVLSLLIIAQIIYLQFFTDLKDKVEDIKTEIMTNRGNIYSHDMKVLAVSIPKYEILIDFYALKTYFLENNSTKLNWYYKKLKLKRDEIKKRSKEQRKSDSEKANIAIDNEIRKLGISLAELFKDKNAAGHENFIRKGYKNSTRGSYRYVRIGQRNIDYIELLKLLNFPIFDYGMGICGLIAEENTDRIPVYGSLAQAVIGRVNKKGLARSGIEKDFDEYIRGKDGLQAYMYVKNNVRVPVSSEVNILPEAGCDVVTTFDIIIQETAEKALIKQINAGNDRGIAIEGGTAIVMETATGEIRAIANMKRNSVGTYDETFNYALMERTDPGSTFKLASLIALLDDGFVELNDIIDIKANTTIENGKCIWMYKNYLVKDDHIFGNLSVKNIFAKSSNIGTAKLVTKYYGNNPQKFFDKIHSLGLFQKSLNLQINGEYPSYAEMETSEKVNPNLLAPSSYGYYVKFSPIHTLTFYNAIANNGKMMKPKFVKKIIRKGKVIKSYPDEVIKKQICSEETLSKAREALQAVVDSGTVKQMKRDLQFDFAGKTGTAQRISYKFKIKIRDTIINDVKQQIADSVRVPYYKDVSGTAYQASFVGYIPSDKPRYSIIVVLYSPKIKGNFYGATYAAPVFKEIAEKLHSTDINWYKPIERNDDLLYLPNAKNTVAQKLKIILSNLDIPVNSNAKSNDWIDISNSDSKLLATKIQIDENKVPSVINMGLRDALYLLEKSGMKVHFSGKGKVKNQSIAAGTTFTKGTTIYLQLE
jgi:cell division protein FtsI (penicillin-binding protein 3)